MIYIFYGPEGSGKTTQAKQLAIHLKLPYISTGDMVRFYAASDPGELGKACQNILEKGIYLSDKYTLSLLDKRFRENDVKKGFVLDGFPRNFNQVKQLTALLAKLHQKVKLVFYLDIDEKTAIKRVMKRKRDHYDSLAKLKSRLSTYYCGEKEILAYYRSKKLLKKINGCPDRKTVFKQILTFINKNNLKGDLL